MKISQCYHIRIRDDNIYDLNVEEYIKEIEEKFGIDFRALPGWKQLIKRLHVMTTDCKRKVQNAKLRKAFIAQKLYIQYSRPSPFELSAKFARTGMRWRRIEMECRKKQRASSKSFTGGSPEWESMHPNTEQGEDSSSALQIYSKVSSDVIKTTNKVTTKEIGLPSSLSSSLPPNICRNMHKLISPIQSQYNGLTPRTQEEQFSIETFTEKRSWMLLDPNLSIKCIPKEIVISEKSLHEQTLKFQLKNCSTEYILIRFKKLTDLSPFKSAKVLPVTTMKVYSGLNVTYRFIFELSQNKEEFTTQLYFKVGRKVLSAAPTEALCVPVVSKLMEPILRSVHISEEVSIPPIFAWHMKPLSYPREYIKIIANGDYFYHLHIVKREPTLPKLSDSTLSTAVEGPDTDSLIQREIDFENEESKMGLSEISTHAKSVESKIKAKSRLANFLSIADAQVNAQKKIIREEIGLIVEYLVNLALDTFILGHTYMYIKPNDRKQISVYLTKIENIGSHNYYYDFNFYSPETEELVMTKTTRIYADILSHPLKIQPELLDMTQSPVVHGFCQDMFIVTNTHKIYPVNIKIKLTTKMKKLFTIIPMETVVPTTSDVIFEVKFWTTDKVYFSENFAHFNIKIITVGHKSVYKNVPPFFYEIIAPCSSEFQNVYGNKYYRDENINENVDENTKTVEYAKSSKLLRIRSAKSSTTNNKTTKVSSSTMVIPKYSKSGDVSTKYTKSLSAVPKDSIKAKATKAKSMSALPDN